MSLPSFGTAAGALHPAMNALIHFLHPVLGQLDTAVAVVLCTALVRALMLPMTLATVRAERARAALAPQLRELRHRHREDQQELAKQTAELYRATGSSPVAGCLPMVLQLPVFMVTYRLFTQSDFGGTANALLHSTLFGAPLGRSLVATLSNGPTAAVVTVFGVLFALLTAVAVANGRRSVRVATANRAAANAPGDEPGISLPDWVLLVMPFGTLLTAAFVPMAAALYLLTTSAWTFAENVVTRRGMPVPAES